MSELPKPLIEEEIKLKNAKEWIKNLEEKSQRINFEEYSKYLNVRGLNFEEIKVIKEYLEELCKKTGYLWKPGCCRCIPKLEKIAVEILKNSVAKNYLNIHSRNYRDEHFFLVALFQDGKEFVIDPTGVPVKEKVWVFPDDIRPYFGLAKYAKGYHKQIYENSS